MAELKTKPTEENVESFLNGISDEKKRQDSLVILELFKKITQKEPRMWGSSIVGFGHYHYHYDSGREGDWFVTGFSPRKDAITLYLVYGLERFDDLMSKLGKYKTGKACLYIKKVEDINLDVLSELIKRSVETMKMRQLGLKT